MEEVADLTMRLMRQRDEMVDELAEANLGRKANGKAVEGILRA